MQTSILESICFDVRKLSRPLRVTDTMVLPKDFTAGRVMLFSRCHDFLNHMQLGEWHYHGLTISGISLAGVRTSLIIPEMSVGFDVAQGLPHALPMNTFLISHGHMDHAAGVPYVISQKSMSTHKTPRFLMPEVMVGPMKEIMNQWAKIEGHTHDYEFIAAKARETYELKANFFIRPFQTVHKVPSLGYSILRRFRKLRADLAGHSSEEIRELKEKGEDVTEERQELVVSFTGDTQIEFLDVSPEVRDSRILVMETTFFDEKRPIESARAWGHTHLDELLPRLSMIRSEKIVLIHSSARYSLDELHSILDKRLPEEEKERIVLFQGR
jgi:ribonuclease Z